MPNAYFCECADPYEMHLVLPDTTTVILEPHDDENIVLINAVCDTATGTYNITPHIYDAATPGPIPTTNIEEIACLP